MNLEQIALLLNKNIKTIQLQKEKLINLKMLNVDTLPKKNYYTLTSKAQSHLGRVHKKSIKVNYYELAHQDMLIKWLCSQTDIEHYQTERELKMENWKLRAYPNLIVYKNDDSEIYVEFDNTKKAPIRIKNKIINYKDWLNNGNKVHWVATNKTLSNWTQKQIIELNLYANQHTYEIWEPNLDKKV